MNMKIKPEIVAEMSNAIFSSLKISKCESENAGYKKAIYSGGEKTITNKK